MSKDEMQWIVGNMSLNGRVGMDYESHQQRIQMKAEATGDHESPWGKQ